MPTESRIVMREEQLPAADFGARHGAQAAAALARRPESARPELLFIAGIMGRVGTNYLARLLVAHPDVCRPTGHWELPLLDVVDTFATFHGRFVARREPGRLDYSFDEFAECFGEGLLGLLVRRSGEDGRTARYLLHKNPSSLGIERLRSFFPGSKVILLVRDGRDNVNSLLRAAGFGECRPWNLRRLAYLYIFSRKWALSARRMLEFLEVDDDCVLVRYEEVHGCPHEVLRRLAAFADLPVPADWLRESAELPVTGSGFLSASGDPAAAEPGRTNWQQVEKAGAFQPVGRWRLYWSALDLWLFNLVAGRELRELGYGAGAPRDGGSI
jgi:hypothetical protein